jgi:hypothetical protein
MASPARKKRTRTLPPLPSIETPPAAQRDAVLAADKKTVLREPTAERAQWRDPDDLDMRMRAPKVVTAFRRVDQLARLQESGAITREQHDAAKRFQRDAEQTEGAWPGRDMAAIRVDATPSGPGEVQLLAIRRYREAVQCLGQRGSAILSMVVLENCSVSDLVRRLELQQHYVAVGMVVAVLDRLCEHYDAPRKARSALASAPAFP